MWETDFAVLGRPSARIPLSANPRTANNPTIYRLHCDCRYDNETITWGEVERRFLLKECGLFANSLAYLIKPNPRIHTVDYTFQEPQSLRDVVLIAANIGFGGFRVKGERIIQFSGAGECICGMAQLGCLNHDRPFDFA